jgi:hypothetical protein
MLSQLAVPLRVRCKIEITQMANVTITSVQTLSGGFATTAAMYDTPVRDAARLKNGVKLIPVNLEGELISALTDAYYGFCYSPASHETGLFAKPSFLGFEVHRIPNGDAVLLGFANADSVKAMEEGKQTVTLDLYPVETNEATNFVQVLRSRITHSKSLDRQHFNRLNLTISGL